MEPRPEPDDVAASLCASGPDEALLGELVAAVHSGRLSARGRVDALVAIEEQKATLEAAQLRLLAAMLADDAGDPDGKLWVREDVAAALRISPRSAGNRLALAHSVATRFPGMLKLLEVGRVSLMHVRKLDELTASLDDDAAGLVEDLVLEQAQTHTVGEFARKVRRTVVKVEGCSAQERHELARKDRRVSIQPVDHGMAELYWLLPADEAAEVAALIDGDTANPHPGDPRVADQRRSDALFQRITGVQWDAHAVRPTVLVTVPLAVLSGDSDVPGELAGHGPIPAGLARRIAADPTGTWKRLVIDDRGRLVDYGRRTYRPPADLARHVVARNQTCCFPGCTRPAARCELDHCRDWARGGRTNADNLHALCARHHHLKYETGWSYADLPDGNIEWASPTGHRYIRRARTYATDADPPPPERPPVERPPLPDDPPF